MKTITKRLISIVLTIMMLITSIPHSVIAAEESGNLRICVSQEIGFPGETVDVVISIKNNPGLSSLKFDVEYGEYLTLEKVSFSSVFGSFVTAPTPYTNPQRLSFMIPDSEITADDMFATLTFAVDENAPNNFVSNILITPILADIFDANLNLVDTDVENGKVTICHRKPGDVDGDNSVANKDAIYTFRYSSGWKIDELTDEDLEWMDVNQDFLKNNMDAVLIFRASSRWTNVKLLPPPVKHIHNLTAVPAKEATCTEDGNIEYWYCSDCGKYFEDEAATKEISFEDTIIESEGHNIVVIPEIAPGYGVEGWTEGEKCSDCGVVTKEPIRIEPLEANEYLISYDYETDKGATYFNAQPKNNSNPTVYTSQSETIILMSPSVPGYTFKGWYDPDGKRWYQITKGTSGNLYLTARFERDVYTVRFDTPNVDVYTTWYEDDKAEAVTLKNEARYTVSDIAVPLPNPDGDGVGQDLVYGYSFVGWSDNNGFLVNSIKAGEIGDKEFHANWVSDRNKATSYSDYDAPIIIEDTDKNQFVFVYNIGRIDNVPLTEYTDNNGKPLFLSDGGPIDVTITSAKTSKFEESSAMNIAETVADATTRSSGWTLSSDWNEVYGAEEREDGKITSSEERTDSKGNIVGGKYFISNSDSGSTFVSNESGSSSSNSAKITTEESVGINHSYDKQTHKYADAELSIENKKEASAGVSFPVKVVDVNVGVKNTTTIGAKASSGRTDDEAVHFDGSASSYVGTENYDTSSEYDVTLEQKNYAWNTQNSYENSHEYSTDESISKAIATEINNSKKYNFSNSLGGSSVNCVSDLESSSTEKAYSNTVVVSNLTETTTEVNQHFKYDANGWYRLMRVGTIHVYAVVGYDVATSSYYTYTFNILDDETKTRMDFSSDGSFKDCENSVVTFDVPYEVHEYVVAMTGKTSGLEFTNGEVTGFTYPNDFSGIVNIPPYCADDSVGDTYAAYRTESLIVGLFENKTEITTVILPDTVSVIPKNAFKGCTNLKTVIAYGVTDIEEGAFSGCTNLDTFLLDTKIASIGKEAFLNVPSIKIMAKDSDVAMQAIESGAKSISVDFANITDTVENRTITATSNTSYLGLQVGGTSGPKDFINVTVDSDATETFISNIVFKDNTDVPLCIDSEKLTLASVTVENAPDFAMILGADNTELTLHKEVVLDSDSNLGVIGKSINITQATVSTGSSITVYGEVLVCGEITDSGKKLKVVDGNNDTYELITSDEYKSYMEDSVNVAFNSNGGSDVVSQSLEYGRMAAEPANPTRNSYSFLGWYTDEACTTEFDFNTPVTSDITLYAKWKLNEFTVTFNPIGGTVSPTSKSVTYGSAYGTLPTPTRTGYTFTRWTLSTDDATINENSVVSTPADHTLIARWNANSYTVKFNTNGGVCSTPSKTVTYDATYGDMPTPTREGHTFNGWYTAKTGGTKITSTTKVSITDEQTLYAQWTANTYTVTFNGNGGTPSKSSQSVTYGGTYGTLPTASKDYYDFNGWYTAASGGTKITSSSTYNTAGNVTLYAQWTIHPVSDWVLESAVPSGAQIVSTKYKYTLTTTASSSSPTMSGFTQTSSEWVKSSSGTHKYVELPNTFDTSNSLYTKYNLSPTSAYDNGSEKLEISSIDTISYIYWHWSYPIAGGKDGDHNRLISTKKTSYYNQFEAFESTTNATSSNGNGTFIFTGQNAWSENWYKYPVYQQNWNKFTMKYNFKKTEQLESTSYPTASNSAQTVSNIQKYVKYRAK